MSETLVNDPTQITVNLKEAREMAEACIRAKLVPMLHGSPAIGKSAIIHQIARDYNLKVIDLRLSQCDPTDLLGFPRINEKTGRAGYAPMETFPLQGDPLPDGYDGWLLFLDEITSAKDGVQAAAYKPIYDRGIGINQLHDRVVLAAAGNLESDNAVVEPMSTALQSRMIHMEVALDANLWIEWAVNNGIDHRITSYIKHKPSALYQFDPEHEDKTYPAPRTWEFASKLIKHVQYVDRSHMKLLAGTIGVGMARTFISYCQIYKSLLTVPQIIADPTGVPVPDEPGTLHALSGSIANNADHNNLDKLMPFVERIPKEFQVICLREVVRRKGELLDHPEVLQWCSANAAALF